MPNRTDFPLLNAYFDVKHIVTDFKKAGISDEAVYKLAISQERIVVTKNVKHFLSLARTDDMAGVIGISPQWLPTQIDNKLTALLRKSNQKDLLGKSTSLK